MTYKKSVIIFLLISVTAVNILPLFNSAAILFENKKKLLKTSKKEFFSTDKFESYRNYIVYKFFNVSLVDDKVVAGKDNFLFLGNAFNNVLDKTIGKFRPDKAKIDDWTDKLKTLQNWYEDRGIKFVIVIAPNKHSIYKDKLPNSMQYTGETITDDIVYSSVNKNIHLLDLRPRLLSIKDDGLLYTKHETHWNNKSASIAYYETIKFLISKYNIKLETPSYKILNNYRGKSPLGRMMKVSSELMNCEDNIYKIESHYNKINIQTLNKKNFKPIGDIKETDNYNVYTNKTPKVIFNKSAMNNKKLLFIADSFSATSDFKIGNTILYNETFQSIYKLHYSHIRGKKLANFIQKINPNIVIYQIAERALYNDIIVKPSPDISHISINNSTMDKRIFNLSQNKYHKNNQFTVLNNNNMQLDVTGRDPIIILNQTKSKSDVILSYEIDSIKKTTFQLFYKESKNAKYNKQYSYRADIKEGNNKFNLLIPSKYINNELRVDLVSDIGKYTIKRFEIYAQ
ncbi:MAG: alginate O-acetyltransferase AlgX-related protein [Thermotogota bacterium]